MGGKMTQNWPFPPLSWHYKIFLVGNPPLPQPPSGYGLPYYTIPGAGSAIFSIFSTKWSWTMKKWSEDSSRTNYVSLNHIHIDTDEWVCLHGRLKNSVMNSKNQQSIIHFCAFLIKNFRCNVPYLFVNMEQSWR